MALVSSGSGAEPTKALERTSARLDFARKKSQSVLSLRPRAALAANVFRTASRRSLGLFLYPTRSPRLAWPVNLGSGGVCSRNKRSTTSSKQRDKKRERARKKPRHASQQQFDTPSSTIPLASGAFARDSLCVSQRWNDSLVRFRKEEEAKSASKRAVQGETLDVPKKSCKSKGMHWLFQFHPRSRLALSHLLSSSFLPRSLSLQSNAISPFSINTGSFCTSGTLCSEKKSGKKNGGKRRFESFEQYGASSPEALVLGRRRAARARPARPLCRLFHARPGEKVQLL